MPELPEVQTVVSDLQKLVGDTIIDFWSDWEKALKDQEGENISQKNFAKKVKGKKILSIERYGKNIFIHLSDKQTIFAHLRMTGQLLIKNHLIKVEGSAKYEKHVHHVFYLKENQALAFSDIRKFATLRLLSPAKLAQIKQSSGTDPFDKDFTLEFLQNALNSKNKTIKEFLMDQSLISGIGNIYASEILFDAKINPLRKSDSLDKSEQKKIYRAIKEILTKAIELRGTSVSDYRDSSGQKGGFQHMLMVYKKNNQKCKKCGTIIKRIVVGQRSTFFCEKCQK